MQFLTLEQLPFSVLHQTFLLAFSDYSIKMEMTESELAARLTRISHKPRLSGGILDGGVLSAFIFTGIGAYQGKKTAYNGGTGVIPSHRGKGLGSKVYHALLERYAEQNIEQCLLEVITDNEKAVKLYKKLGFRISRLFKCYANPQKLDKVPANIPLQISQAESISWEKYQKFCTSTASWQNTQEAILRDINQELVLEAYSKTDLIGFIAFNPVNGKVSQLAVAPDFRRVKVGTNLIRSAQRMSQKNCATLNVDEQDTAACHFFESLGFTNPIDQYEMILDL